MTSRGRARARWTIGVLMTVVVAMGSTLAALPASAAEVTLRVVLRDDQGAPITAGPTGSVSLIHFEDGDADWTDQTWYRGSSDLVLTVTPGQTYTVRVADSAGDYASAYLGAPTLDDATRVTPTADTTVTLTLPRAVSVRGSIALAPGVKSASRTAQVWSLDPVDGSVIGTRWARTGGDGAFEVRGIHPGRLRVAFLNESGLEPALAHEYFRGASVEEDAQLIDAAPGQVVSGINGTLRAWSFLPTTRIAGDDRYSTALEVSHTRFSSAEWAVIASGTAWPDALAAAPVAAELGGPLLLTPSDRLAPGLLNELKRLGVTRVLIAGGRGVVSDAVAGALKKVATVIRVGGSDRYATSRALVDYGFSDGSSGYLATGADYPDALSAAAVPGQFVLLVPPVPDGGFDDSLRRFLDDRDLTVGVVGGLGALDESYDKLANYLAEYYGTAERFAGADRYETNRMLVERPVNVLTQNSHAYLASGIGFADALAAAPVAAIEDAPLYLARPRCVDAALKTELRMFHLRAVVLVGGSGVLSPEVAALRSC